MKLINLLAIASIVLALGACSKQDDSTAADKTSDAAGSAMEKTKEVGMGAMETTKDATGKAVEYTGNKMEEAGKAMSESGESLQKGERSEGSLPIMEMGQQARCGTLYLLEYTVPNLRVSPNEAYHEAVVCTTSILAQSAGPQPAGPCPAWPDAR